MHCTTSLLLATNSLILDMAKQSNHQGHIYSPGQPCKFLGSYHAFSVLSQMLSNEHQNLLDSLSDRYFIWQNG